MLLRDADLSTAWNAQADALDTRHYYCQNWRADVSVIIDDSAVLIERVMYSPYGVPFGIPAGDLVTTASFAEPADGVVNSADLSALLGLWGSSYNIADLDNDGDVDGFDLAILNGNWGKPLGWGAMSLDHNRLGYAGYVFDEALAGTKWHVRHRVLESVLGRWMTRDPGSYNDGWNLFQSYRHSPLRYVDPSGLVSVAPPPPDDLRRLRDPNYVPACWQDTLDDLYNHMITQCAALPCKANTDDECTREKCEAEAWRIVQAFRNASRSLRRNYWKQYATCSEAQQEVILALYRLGDLKCWGYEKKEEFGFLGTSHAWAEVCVNSCPAVRSPTPIELDPWPSLPMYIPGSSSGPHVNPNWQPGCRRDKETVNVADEAPVDNNRMTNGSWSPGCGFPAE